MAPSLAHWSQSSAARKIVRRLVAADATRQGEIIGSSRSASLSRSLVLKEGRAEERGVLLVSFEKELAKLVSLRNFHDIEQRYRILFMPSWLGVVSEPLLRLAALSRRSFGVLPSHLEKDRAMVLALSPNARYYPFHAASWVHAGRYKAGWTRDKSIDVLMVSSFMRFKRHWRLFRAMAGTSPKVRTTIVGMPMEGRSADTIYAEAQLFGVASRVNIVVGPTQEALRKMYTRAKLVCSLSHQEGACIAVAEALLADTPVLCLSNAEFGTKVHITDQTGFRVPSREFTGQRLEECIGLAADMRPGPWAVENLSSRANVRALSDQVRSDALAEGEVWTRDLAQFHSEQLALLYSDPEFEGASLEASRAELLSFGLFVCGSQ